MPVEHGPGQGLVAAQGIPLAAVEVDEQDVEGARAHGPGPLL